MCRCFNWDIYTNGIQNADCKKKRHNCSPPIRLLQSHRKNWPPFSRKAVAAKVLAFIETQQCKANNIRRDTSPIYVFVVYVSLVGNWNPHTCAQGIPTRTYVPPNNDRGVPAGQRHSVIIFVVRALVSVECTNTLFQQTDTHNYTYVATPFRVANAPLAGGYESHAHM